MSCTRSSANLIQGSRFFINVAAVNSDPASATTTSDAYDVTGAEIALPGRAAAAQWAAATTGAPGTVRVRDMGKTVRIASQGATAHAAGTGPGTTVNALLISLVLRKVQIVDTTVTSVMGAADVPLSNFIGLNEGVGGTIPDTIYIQLSPASKWASVSF